MRYASAPVSTYRLQLEPDFTLDDAVAQVDHLATLGITHLYLSPILQATVGSKHGYDVIDHTTVAEGSAATPAFARARRGRPRGRPRRRRRRRAQPHDHPDAAVAQPPAVVGAPRGPDSAYATWFDVDWDAQGGRILMPVLGAPLDEVLAAGEISVGRARGRAGRALLRPRLPARARHRPDAAARPSSSTPSTTGSRRGRVGGRASSTTAASSTSTSLDRGPRRGARGLRRHPRAARRRHPRRRDRRPAHRPPGRPRRPRGLPRAARRGDRRRVGRRREDPRGRRAAAARLADGRHHRLRRAAARRRALRRPGRCSSRSTTLSTALLGERQDLEAIVTASKRWVVQVMLATEVQPAARGSSPGRGPDLDADAARARSSRRCSSAWTATASTSSRARRPPEADARRARSRPRRARADACGRSTARPSTCRRRPRARRQARRRTTRPRVTSSSCGSSRRAVRPWPRAIEDTAFYRYVPARRRSTRWAATPTSWACRPTELPRVRAATCWATWPQTMTTLSTHDTKRAEDVRARLSVLAERPDAWARWVRTARELAAPYRAERARRAHRVLPLADPRRRVADQRGPAAGLRHSRRFARPSCTRGGPSPTRRYESAVERFVSGVVTTPRDRGPRRVVGRRDAAARRGPNVLGQKLVQLTLPGVPDVYQGTDLVDLSLVDPDNRRAVDYADRRGSARPSRRRCRPGRPRRREAARDEPRRCARAGSGPSASPGEDATYRRRRDDVRARRRLRSRHAARPSRSSRW